MKSKSYVIGLLNQFIEAAQKVYDSWDEDLIEELNGGGICHLIAEEFCSILAINGIDACEVTDYSIQHVYTIMQLKDGIYSLDIPPYNYEIGGGYSWVKIPDVIFNQSLIEIYLIDSDSNNFNLYIEE